MKSLWSENVKFSSWPSLDENIETEVCVVGGGLAGLLTAYMLKESGKKVIVIEGGKVASGNIQNSSAKITSQHKLIYKNIIKEFGKDKARQYLEAQEAAIKKYKEIINKENIQCDFEETQSFIYTLKDANPILEEYEAVKSLGLDAEIATEIELPLKITMALKFKNQAQFHPLKFLYEISKNLTIFENTRALDVKNDRVITDKGEIIAKHIIIATHFPFINSPGYFFAKMHQERSYVIGLTNAPKINGMYIDINKEGLSFRNYNNLLLVGGVSQRTGKNINTDGYENLRNKVRVMLPKSREVYYWSSQDCMTHDNIPYIGRVSNSIPNLYIATGFNKWGMTNSMVSAMIINDLIVSGKSQYEDVFSPKRFDFSSSIGNLAIDGFEATKGLISEQLHISFQKLEDIPCGGGGIISKNGEKVGVYKSATGKVYYVKTKCPHLGCELQWNGDDLSWDCPCHGSRFDYKGKILDSPSTKGIEYDKF